MGFYGTGETTPTVATIPKLAPVLAAWVKDYEAAAQRLKKGYFLMDAATITIAEVGPTKHPRFLRTKTIDGKTYSFDKNAVNLSTGQTYNVMLQADLVNGKTYYTIVKATAAPAPTPAGSGASGDGIMIAPWYMNFVSNVVAHAIGTSAITDPGTIQQWALAAKRAAEACAADAPSKYDPFDGEPPPGE